MNSFTDNLCINTVRFLSVDMINKAKSGHPGIALGAAPIIHTLFTRHLNINPENPNWFDRDRFILSAGHGSSMLYATLHLAGYDVTIDDIKQFRQLGSKTPGHPEVFHTPGVEVTTGPLGQGIAMGVGMAIAEIHLSNNYGDVVVGIFENSALNDYQHARDMICVAVCEKNYNKWFMDARETICHEMQHIVNFSAKSRGSEDLWIDEGLSVCSEILYRQNRHKDGLMTYSLYYGGERLDFAGNDARFYYAEYLKPELSLLSFSSSDTDIALAHYGQKGLFFYYLYEQYGIQ